MVALNTVTGGPRVESSYAPPKSEGRPAIGDEAPANPAAATKKLGWLTMGSEVSPNEPVTLGLLQFSSPFLMPI